MKERNLTTVANTCLKVVFSFVVVATFIIFLKG